MVGPEGPLALGLVDALAAKGNWPSAHSRAAAALESSKAFAKDLFDRHGIPTARFGTFDDPAAARAFVAELGGRAVVKADGLAAGKGAVLCADPRRGRLARSTTCSSGAYSGRPARASWWRSTWTGKRSPSSR